jgi:hypothetical protein
MSRPALGDNGFLPTVPRSLHFLNVKQVGRKLDDIEAMRNLSVNEPGPTPTIYEHPLTPEALVRPSRLYHNIIQNLFFPGTSFSSVEYPSCSSDMGLQKRHDTRSKQGWNNRPQIPSD